VPSISQPRCLESDLYPMNMISILCDV